MPRWTIGVDTGGTFTDCIAHGDDGSIRRAKVPSSGELRARIVGASGASLVVTGLPAVSERFWHGFTVLLDGDRTFTVMSALRTGGDAAGAQVHGDVRAHPMSSPARGEPSAAAVTLELDADVPPHAGPIARITCDCAVPVLTARIAIDRPISEPLDDIDLRVGTTIGTNALLEGRTARVLLLTTRGHEDALLIGDQRRRDIFALAPSRRSPIASMRLGIPERIGADGTIVTPLDADDVHGAIAAARDAACEAVAIAFVHSGVNATHERQAALMLAAGPMHVVSSSDTAVSTSFLPRAQAAVIEAALRPAIGGFADRLARDAHGARIFLSTSAGCPVPASDFMAKDCLLSGPATGVAAAARSAVACGFERCVTLDVGGTSADAARATCGMPDLARTTVVADVELASPCVAVESVAAGGGSILWFDGSALRVGPHSAGASPGPACYGGGGPLTLTDAHLLLGRIDPKQMPIPLDVEAAARAAESLCADVNAHRTVQISQEALLREFIAIADETMAGAIRSALARAGESPHDHALVAFGGAGGLHACSIAALLGMPAVILPAEAGLLCAQGACVTPLHREESRVALVSIGDRGWQDRIMDRVNDAIGSAQGTLGRWGVAEASTALTITLVVRRKGQEEGLPVSVDVRGMAEHACATALEDAFRAAWHARFGTPPDDRPLEIEQIRVLCRSGGVSTHDAASHAIRAHDGPALRSRMGSTAWIPPGWRITERSDGSAVLVRATGNANQADGAGAAAHDGTRTPVHAATDAVEGPSTERIASALSAAASEMGEQLRRTALSVNVRDRMDFSCGILDAASRLIVNAPHIPVHLGALGACVRAVRSVRAIAPGDVWCVNHPGYGGAHLPDVTVLAAVHERDDPHRPGTHLGFVAARAHHAEIGGTRPGSMPPDARHLSEEGIVIPPTRIVAQGRECLDDVRRLLHAGSWPSRSPEENIADLRAQVASLVTGRDALRAIAGRFGVDAFAGACGDIAASSSAAARDAIGWLRHRVRAAPLFHTVSLDDGTPLQVRISFDADDSLELDFDGTGGPHPGNLNMPESVTRASILYVMRLLVACARGRDCLGLPVAESLLDPVTIRIPRGCILGAEIGDDASRAPAVAVGQTDTAQRLVDLLLHALGLAAESQGTMNNLLFGGANWGFYETICGGAGGSRDGPGCDAIHTHLTNTRITDVEVLERRHPVRVERFSVRAGTGGAGAQPGGDGAIRAIRFLAPAAGSFLSQHRASAPRGVHGGTDGTAGTQRIEHPDGTVTALGGRAAFDAQPGDLLVIETPGGGGFGAPT